MSAALPGTSNVTRALRPSLDTSDCPLAGSGALMPAAYFGWADSAAATWPTACRIPGSELNVTPGVLAWISTDSGLGWNCAGAAWSSTRSACPDCPGSYCGRFAEPIACAAMKTPTTSSSQPKTAVLRCRALQPATHSVGCGGPAGRSPACRQQVAGGARTEVAFREYWTVRLAHRIPFLGESGCYRCEQAVAYPRP